MTAEEHLEKNGTLVRSACPWREAAAGRRSARRSTTCWRRVVTYLVRSRGRRWRRGNVHLAHVMSQALLGMDRTVPSARVVGQVRRASVRRRLGRMRARVPRLCWSLLVQIRWWTLAILSWLPVRAWVLRRVPLAGVRRTTAGLASIVRRERRLSRRARGLRRAIVWLPRLPRRWTLLLH